MQTRQFLQIIGSVFLGGCSSQTAHEKPAPKPFTALPKVEQEICDAVFRYMIAREEPKRRCYLGLFGADAPRDLLDRYQAEGLPTLLGSSYREGRGVHCTIFECHILSATHAEVSAEYTWASLAAEFGILKLTKRRERWVVTSWKVEILA